MSFDALLKSATMYGEPPFIRKREFKNNMITIFTFYRNSTLRMIVQSKCHKVDVPTQISNFDVNSFH